MNDLADLLEQAGVRTALVVDDAYDQVPTANDLTVDQDEWINFFEDLSDADRRAVSEFFPEYDRMRADELRVSNEFIAVLWANRDALGDGVVDALFARYQHDMETDLAYLESLVSQLEALGLACEKTGRDFQKDAETVDLIVIDLFLGSGQEQQDIERSIVNLKQVVEKRVGRPPLVVLMSRSPRLSDKREEYRDRAGLFESAFRIIRKAELIEPNKLSRVLSRLSNHYSDSLKLAEFLFAWNSGIEGARERTSRLIRRLDLPEISQVRHLLLEAEEAPTGGYLVDVFDRVLQHELEADASIIDAAIALNDLTPEKYPPPYVAGSRELQNLVHSSLFQHPERLRLSGSESRVSFGDLIRRKPLVDGAEAEMLTDISGDNILAVMSPACDLQRQGAKRVLLLVGDVRALVPSEWTYKSDSARTSVYKFEGGQAFWIKWNLKHIETVSHQQLDVLLGADGEFEVSARLRESHAIELQQKLLADLGRIGMPAAMPATFSVDVSVYVPGLEKKPLILNVPALDDTSGVCYVGRDKEMRLVLCEEVCEAICDAVQAIDLSTVHQNSHEALEYLRSTSELLLALEKGISLPGQASNAWKDIPSPTGATRELHRQIQPRVVGLIGNFGCVDKSLSNPELNKAGILIVVRFPE
ncbi:MULTISPECIES: hypothetical protein [Pseudomonas]|uniref:hypothetical protein n=1 Tax=Pseudomonas TaxID=286 RepID=UPI0013CEF4D6|nr:hypothetical protein [Pseudomonas viridiflava]